MVPLKNRPGRVSRGTSQIEKVLRKTSQRVRVPARGPPNHLKDQRGKAKAFNYQKPIKNYQKPIKTPARWRYGPKPFKSVGFGDTYGPKSYEFMGFGDTYGTKPYKFIGFGDTYNPVVRYESSNSGSWVLRVPAAGRQAEHTRSESSMLWPDHCRTEHQEGPWHQTL